MVRCPCHEDSHPSLAVRLSPTGSPLLHCFGGCTSTREGYLEVLRRLDLDSSPLAVAEPTAVKPPLPTPRLPPLSPDLIAQLPERAYEYLWHRRRISPSVAKRYGLGCAQHRLAIPIWDKDQNLADIRLWLRPSRRDGAQPKIRSWERGRGGQRLFPIPRTPDVLVCGGELDALAAISLGYPAITTTGSESSFPRRLAKELRDLGVKTAHVLLDADDTGRAGTALRVERLREVGIAADPIWWPSDRPKGHDITDEILSTGKLAII